MSVLYDFIYLLPIYILVFGLGNVYLDFMKFTPAQMAIALVVMITVTVLKRAERRIQFMAVGVVILISVISIWMQKPEERFAYMQQFTWIGKLVLEIVVVCCIGYAMTKWYWVQRIVSVVIILMLILFLFYKLEMPRMIVLAAMLLLVMGVAEEVQRYWSKYGEVDRKKHLVSVMPFMFVCCVFVAMMPVSKKPFDWTFIVRAYEKVEQQMNRVSGMLHFGSDDFGSDLAGFSEKGRVTGDADENNKVVLQLKVEKNAGDVLYLTGKTFQEFEKQEWREVEYDVEHERTLDAVETIAAVQKYDRESMYDYFMRKNVEVIYQEFNTKYIFAPDKSIVGNDKIFRLNYQEKGPDILATKKLGYGSKYEMNYYDLNTGNPAFQSFLRSENVIDQTEWDAAVSYCHLGGKNGYDYDTYQKYRNMIPQIYLPDVQVSDRTKEYVDTIIEGASSKVEQLQRIERELRGYEYNTADIAMPKTIKTESDFLDYFLFEKKEGYCVHFATTFVLLARYLGVPARYVKGYYVPVKGKENITVTQSMAHAWPEVYLEGIGWIPFEPTPGYVRLAYWQTAEQKASAVVVKADGDSQYVRNGNEESVEEDDDIFEEEENYSIPWRLLAVMAGSIILFLLVCGRLHAFIRKCKYEKMSVEQKMRILCNRNIQLASILGYPLMEGETLEEYGVRLLDTMDESGIAFLACYEKCIYAKGKYDIDDSQFEVVTRSYDILLQILKQQNMLKYMLYVFLQ